MSGYFETANINVPLNRREKGEVADVAKLQLHEYEERATVWPVYTDGRCNRCRECHQNIWFSKDPHGTPYAYKTEEILALKVAHIRQAHDG
jgi:hypothetical protein